MNMTGREGFLEIHVTLNRKGFTSHLLNGVHRVSPDAQVITHVELATRPGFLTELLQVHAFGVCPTIQGKWWILPMTPEGLMRHIITVCYDLFPEWKQDAVSHFLAYLTLAVIAPSAYTRVFATAEMQIPLARMREVFHERHPMWDYVFFSHQEV